MASRGWKRSLLNFSSLRRREFSSSIGSVRRLYSLSSRGKLMSTYRAPLRDMQFVLNELAGVGEIAKLPGFEDTPDVLDAILQEASTFAAEVLDPINRSGDIHGCKWNDGVVTTAPAVE